MRSTTQDTKTSIMLKCFNVLFIECHNPTWWIGYQRKIRINYDAECGQLRINSKSEWGLVLQNLKAYSYGHSIRTGRLGFNPQQS